MSELTKDIEIDEGNLLLYEPNKNVSRESCLECVTKHFSAAMILASELISGYEQYKYLFIGHLHEAHEEAQEFPQLYKMLVDARRNFQRKNEMPDFSKISDKIEETKKYILENEDK